MRYFLDTEFEEDGTTIMPISLALVAEDERELYLEFDFDVWRASNNDFVREQVLPHLSWAADDRLSVEAARERILEFIGDDHKPVFWAYYGDYDWVLFCRIFGRMVDLPAHFPQLCLDLQQAWMREGRLAKPAQPRDQHNALADARWNRDLFLRLARQWSQMEDLG